MSIQIVFVELQISVFSYSSIFLCSLLFFCLLEDKLNKRGRSVSIWTLFCRAFTVAVVVIMYERALPHTAIL